MSGHTATPWRYLPNRKIVDRRGHFVADVQLGISSSNFDEMEAKGALIVTACNSHADLVRALEKIEKWFGEFPETGRFWDDQGKQEPMSYSAAFGSNGERDFMRAVAREALATLTARRVG